MEDFLLFANKRVYTCTADAKDLIVLVMIQSFCCHGDIFSVLLIVFRQCKITLTNVSITLVGANSFFLRPNPSFPAPLQSSWTPHTFLRTVSTSTNRLNQTSASLITCCIAAAPLSRGSRKYRWVRWLVCSPAVFDDLLPEESLIQFYSKNQPPMAFKKICAA